MDHALDSQLEISVYEGDVTPLTEQHRTPWRTLPSYVLVNQQNVIGRVQTNSCDYLADGGNDSYLIARQTPHKLTWLEGRNPVSVWCHFNVTLLHSIDYLSFFEIPRKFETSLSDALRECCRLLVTPSEGSPLLAMTQKRKLAWELLALILSGCKERPDARQQLRKLDALAPALKYIDRHLGPDFELAEAAKSMNLSVSRFSALFRSAMAVSPVAYRNMLRLERAYQRLSAGASTPKEIAAELGFYDVFHFAKAFKRQFGVTPTALLRRLTAAGRF